MTHWEHYDEIMSLEDVEKDVLFKLSFIQVEIDMIKEEMEFNKKYYHGDYIVDDKDRGEYKAILINSFKKLIDVKDQLKEIYDDI